MILDDLIAHGHLQLQFHVHDALQTVLAEDVKERLIPVALHRRVNLGLQRAPVCLVALDLCAYALAGLLVLAHVFCHVLATLPQLGELRGGRGELSAGATRSFRQLLVELREVRLILHIGVLKLEEGLLQVDARLHVDIDVVGQCIQPRELRLVFTARHARCRHRPRDPLLGLELRLQLIDLLLQVVDHALVVRDVALHGADVGLHVGLDLLGAVCVL